MSIELKFLIYAALFGLFQLLLTGLPGIIQHGVKYALGPRDEQLPISGKWARVVRAYNNYLQSFVFFAVAVIVAQLVSVHNEYTITGAKLYFWARIVYLPIYVAGISILRTLVWTISIIGIISVIMGIGTLDFMLNHM